MLKILNIGSQGMTRLFQGSLSPYTAATVRLPWRNKHTVLLFDITYNRRVLSNKSYVCFSAGYPTVHNNTSQLSFNGIDLLVNIQYLFAKIPDYCLKCHLFECALGIVSFHTVANLIQYHNPLHTSSK